MPYAEAEVETEAWAESTLAAPGSSKPSQPRGKPRKAGKKEARLPPEFKDLSSWC